MVAEGHGGGGDSKTEPQPPKEKTLDDVQTSTKRLALSTAGAIRSALKDTLEFALEGQKETKRGIVYGESTKPMLQQRNIRFDKSNGGGGRT